MCAAPDQQPVRRRLADRQVPWPPCTGELRGSRETTHRARHHRADAYPSRNVPREDQPPPTSRAAVAGRACSKSHQAGGAAERRLMHVIAFRKSRTPKARLIRAHSPGGRCRCCPMARQLATVPFGGRKKALFLRQLAETRL